MRQRLIFLLKHNSKLQSIYKVVMSLIFRIWGCFIKEDENLVLFVSFMGLGFNDSPKAIYNYLINDSELSKLQFVWAFEQPERYAKFNLKSVKIDTINYFRIALKAKYWITNTNIERGLHFKKKSQIYLNTWHGIALKHIGNDVAGRSDFNFSEVNYLCVCGDYDERVFKTAFNANSSSYLKCGLPRNEELWNASVDKKDLIKSEMGIPLEKKVILYAPTWRESTNGGRSYDIKPPIHFDLWERKLGEEYVVLFRAHHQTTKVLGISYNEFVRDVSSYPEINDLLICADILVTDYSAIAFDYSILCKPIFCYAYDYETYLKDRGTYFEIDAEYPNKSCRTEKELLSRIMTIDYETECINTKMFRDKFVMYGIGATETCVKAVFHN